MSSHSGIFQCVGICVEDNSTLFVFFKTMKFKICDVTIYQFQKKILFYFTCYILNTKIYPYLNLYGEKSCLFWYSN